MSKKHQHWILVYLVIGVAVALIRRQWGGGSVYPLVSALTAQDIIVWPYSAFTMANLYRETGSIAGGPLKK